MELSEYLATPTRQNVEVGSMWGNLQRAMLMAASFWSRLITYTSFIDKRE